MQTSRNRYRCVESSDPSPSLDRQGTRIASGLHGRLRELPEPHWRVGAVESFVKWMSPVEAASGNDAQRFYNHVNTELIADGLT